MKLSEICRESNSVIEFTEPLSNLAQEAEDVLGYSRLKQEREPESTLLRKLAVLQVDTLKLSNVRQYQAEQLIEQTNQKLQKWIAEGATGSFFGPGWRRIEIAKYSDPIPEFVLNKAIQIKREIPDVRIFVESLEDYPDPFLIIAIKHPQYECLNAEEYYVEVWAEPKFEGKLR